MARTLAPLLLLLITVPASAAESALEQRIRAFVSERAEVDGADVIVPPLADFALPAGLEGPVEVRLTANPGQDFQGVAPITVSLVSGGRELKRGSVSVRVRRETDAWVAARALPAKHAIGRSDLIRTRLDEAAPPDLIVDAAEIVGRQTTRSIAAGTPWRARLVEDAPVVARGQLVKIRLVSGSLRIDGVARAREDAAIGERIRVQIPDSRRELVGTVAPDGVVHVAH